MLRTGILLFAALAFAGCSTQYLEPEPVENTRPDVVFEPPIAEITSSPLARIPFPPPLPRVAIVLTNSQPAYADVARELAGHLKKYEIYDLSDAGQVPITVMRSINDSDTGAVVAIGLRAARSSVAMAEKPVVFSQVFNYRAHDLLQENSRGVAALAPLDAQLAAWKELDPTVTRIGIIVGTGSDDLIADARRAADRHGIDLLVRETQSDQETLYVFRRIIHDIDGFWLFPDSRVLSARVLQQMLQEASRQQVPVAVPSESMLQLGAKISMSTVASDIAATIIRVLREIQVSGLAQVPPITQLSEIRVATLDTPQVVER